MSENKRIDAFYKILGLYEDAKDGKIDFMSYSRYVYNLYVKYLGLAEKDIYGTLKGIYDLGDTIDHSTLKSLVFHLIKMEG